MIPLGVAAPPIDGLGRLVVLVALAWFYVGLIALTVAGAWVTRSRSGA